MGSAPGDNTSIVPTGRPGWDWRKTRRRCDTPGGEQGTLTEPAAVVKHRALADLPAAGPGSARPSAIYLTPALPPRHDATALPDRTAARAFTADADEQLAHLDEQQEPVEAGRGRRRVPPRRLSSASTADPGTGEVTQRCSEWLTHLVDLGSGRTGGLAEGRTAAAEKDLLAGHAAPPCGTWRWTCR